MKRLNFYPYYESLLRSRTKTTTFRLSRPSFNEGDEVLLSVGWDEKETTDLHPVHISKVYQRRIGDLNDVDFSGESPDCQSVEATQLVLGCIYRTVLSENDEIWVVQFVHK